MIDKCRFKKVVTNCYRNKLRLSYAGIIARQTCDVHHLVIVIFCAALCAPKLLLIPTNTHKHTSTAQQ